ncbi:ATP-dependent DNA helicase PIF1-like [Cotesia glomerata]|uniref:ATP-dependent DNA helicase PIF1-like n=1 Tax=Cotesia glomerata TaxID=32391 RepID=UPI001D00FAEC|nr:ATP-dependent DNA helicase PIF1-like [Cotesia glomerata]
MRVLPEETEMAEFLLSIGNGTLNDNDDYVDMSEELIAPATADIAEDISGNLIKNNDYEKLTKVAILSPRNLDVDDINNKVVDLLDASTENVYESIDSTENCDNGDINADILVEYLHTINPPNFPPHKLRLRLYSVVMLVRNLSINEGLCNGTRLLIIEFGTTLLKCKILTGDKMGEIVFINRITLYIDHNNAFTFKRRQFPIRLAFAMTINKSQGQTFESIGIDLHKDVFNHGQLYVAMSRVKSRSALKLYLHEPRTNNRVKNYVYKELYGN